MATADLSNPILNSPYDPPEAHFEIGENGPTGVILPGRRPSESFIPVPPTKKGRKGSAGVEELTLDVFDATGERREHANSLPFSVRVQLTQFQIAGLPREEGGQLVVVEDVVNLVPRDPLLEEAEAIAVDGSDEERPPTGRAPRYRAAPRPPEQPGCAAPLPPAG